MLTVAELIRYRLQNERYVHRVAEAQLPTAHGEFRMIAYESEAGVGQAYGGEGEAGGDNYVALVYGDLKARRRPTSRCWCACIRIAWQEICLGRRLCNCAETLGGVDARDC